MHPNCHPSGRQSQLALDLPLDAEGRAGALTASRGAGDGDDDPDLGKVGELAQHVSLGPGEALFLPSVGARRGANKRPERFPM